MKKPAASKNPGKYHKDNLRADLLKAAQRVVQQEGHEQLSIRRLAQETGVSPGAPYHHFADKRSLLLAVALEGYRTLNDWPSDPDATGAELLFELCNSFLRFAGENPRLLTLMYDSEITRPIPDPAIAQAQSQGADLLHRAILAITPDITQAELSLRSVAIWSTIFGFALMRNLSMIQTDDIADPFSAKVTDALVGQAISMLQQNTDA